jgi:hypothetical protein
MGRDLVTIQLGEARQGAQRVVIIIQDGNFHDVATGSWPYVPDVPAI